MCAVSLLIVRSRVPLHTLSVNLKARYTEKVTASGLKTDPYVIPDESWTEEPMTVLLISWSDLFVYIILTPSPYTKQELKVRVLKLFLNVRGKRESSSAFW